MFERRTGSWWMVFAVVVLLTSVAGEPAGAQLEEEIVEEIFIEEAQQEKGSFELYLGSYFPDGEQVDEDVTYGIRAGYRFLDRFGLQGTLGRYETEIDFLDLETTFADLSLVWFMNPHRRAEFLIYGGPGWAFLEAGANLSEVSDDSLTAHLGLGVDIGLGGRFFLRPDLRARWFEQGDNEIDIEASLAVGLKVGRAAEWIPIGEEPTDAGCRKYKLLVKHAYSECNRDGFWHVVTDAYYTCVDPEGGVYGPRRTSDIRTRQACRKGASPPPILTLADLVYPTLRDRPCRSPRYLGDMVLLQCENGMWEWHTYLLYECLDGSLRRSWKGLEVTGKDCALPPGPLPFRVPVLPLPTWFKPV